MGSLRSPGIAANHYFICLGDGNPPIAWDLSDQEHPVRVDCVYFGRALAAMEAALQASGLTVYLTWDLKTLPTYGKEVIAVVIGDEDAHMPRYAGRVGAIFKCYGSRPYVGASFFRHPSRANFLVLLQGIRRCAKHLPDDARSAAARMGGSVRGRVHPIPLGYYNQLALPIMDFPSRPTEVFFAGSLERSERSRLSPRRWLHTPAAAARQEMIDAVRIFERMRPDAKVKLRLTKSFSSHQRSDAAAYSQSLMKAKVCLAPRGGSVETYRFFEALRYGCVVVTEPLPRTWFYHGSPAVVIRRWRALPSALTSLLDDPVGLQERHQATLTWWRERCSEEALGKFMASRLRRELPEPLKSHGRSSDVGR